MSAGYVLLKGGLATPMAPVALLLDLERRGLRFERRDGDLDVQPTSLLTDAEREALALWKSHALALLDYAPPEGQ